MRSADLSQGPFAPDGGSAVERHRDVAVEVVLFRLSQWSGHADAFREILAPDERERVSRCRRPLEALRFTLSRGILRTFLAERIGTAPAEVCFSYNPFGKPRIADAAASSPSFSLSQSGDWCLIGCDRSGTELGVDLQVSEGHADLSALAEKGFSADEACAIAALPAHSRARAFSQLWTVKEAFTKGVGHGLLSAFRSLDFSDAFGCPVTDLDSRRLARVECEGQDWEVRPLTSGDPFSAALACRAGAQVIYSNSLASIVFGGEVGEPGARRNKLPQDPLGNASERF